MKEELISIIIPAYNSDKYIDRCLKSVLNQTYKNLEIILVDDGSTDNTGKICDDYSKKDKRIRVVHQKNGGLSSARNAGLKIYKGEYLYFLDSDDTITKNCIEEMYRKAIEEKCDIVITPYINIKDDNEKPYFKTDESKYMNVEEALKQMLLANYFDVSACGKLYKKSVIKSIEFPLGKLCEDNGTTYKFIMNAKRIYYINEPFYKYYINSNSIMNGTFNYKKYDLVTLTDQMCEEIVKKYKSLYEVCFRRRVYARLSFLRQALAYKDFNKKDERIIDSKKYIKKNFKYIMNMKIVPKRDKIASFLLMLGNGVYSFSWKIYSKIR